MKNAPVEKVFKILHRKYPGLEHYLNFASPLQLLVATILSAQVRDSAVNAATPALFKRYKTAKDFAHANLMELTGMIKTITFANNKAKFIKRACALLIDKHEGKIPKTIEELTKLPGIGRKTANAIIQNAFGIVHGIVVDTHVLRVSYRFGWASTAKNAVKTEKELMSTISKNEWKDIPHLMKRFGRETCKAPIPLCSTCEFNTICPKIGVTKSK
jgi:endonuclease III